MSEKAVTPPQANPRDEAFLQKAQQAWETRLAESGRNAEAVKWGQSTADALVQRAERRAAS